MPNGLCEKLKNIDGVLNVKSELVSNIRKNGDLIVPNENLKHLNYWKSLRNDINLVTFGMNKSADFYPIEIKYNLNGTKFRIQSKKYNKEKFSVGKGFEVFSVSLDRAEEPWKKAIVDDSLLWDNHGWDKDGIVSRRYNVTSIPYAVLIDGKGNVLAKGENLRGLGLHITLDKFINSSFDTT